MPDRATLKAFAKERLAGNWGNAILCAVIALVLGGIQFYVEQHFDSSGQIIGCNFVLSFFFIGITWTFLGLARQGSINLSTVIEPFGCIGKTFLVYALVYIITWAGFLLLIVPGIIFSLGFSQSYFILRDHPELSASDILRESWRLMRGHKGEYFVLLLSFFGWLILSGITFGIVGLYVIPYMETTLAAYYDSLVGSHNEIM